MSTKNFSFMELTKDIEDSEIYDWNEVYIDEIIEGNLHYMLHNAPKRVVNPFNKVEFDERFDYLFTIVKSKLEKNRDWTNAKHILITIAIMLNDYYENEISDYNSFLQSEDTSQETINAFIALLDEEQDDYFEYSDNLF